MIEKFNEGLRPVKRLLPSEWAEKYRVLDSVASAEPGRWKNNRTPYLVEIMDCFSPYSPVREVVIMKGSQVGLTEAGFNIMGFTIDTDPCPMLYVMPTDSTVKKNSKIRFDPMVRNCENLRDKVSVGAVKSRSNSMTEKSFPGGILIFVGANSPAGMRSLPIKFACVDELDAMPSDVGGEGNPLALVQARTNTFAQKKILVISTPTLKGSSMIEAEYETTDKRLYHVPCPECGLMQVLIFENLVYEDLENVKYKCAGCDALIDEKQKPFMLKNGEWRSTNPAGVNSRRRGYHLSGLYSPYGWLSWREVIEKYQKAQTDTDLMKVFTNTVLGESYEVGGDMPDWETLFGRKENYPTYRPPTPVKMITCGVDVQKDRLELELTGWCVDKQSYSVDYRVIIGNTSLQGPGSVWEELRKVLSEPFEREDGRILYVRQMCVDSGYNTSEVYDFVRSCDPSQVVAVKGRDNLSAAVSPPRPFEYTSNGTAIKFTRLWGVGTNFLKSEIYGKLKIGISEDGTFPPGFCHFPSAYDANYFKMLCAEKQVKELRNGSPVFVWKKTFTRNEALDARIYSRAAFSITGADRWTPEQWAIVEKSYTQSQPKQPEKKSRRSSFWD